MPQKKHRPEEIVAKLRQVDVLLSQGRSAREEGERRLRKAVSDLIATERVGEQAAQRALGEDRSSDIGGDPRHPHHACLSVLGLRCHLPRS
jgi:hypothetical protein